MKKWIKAGFGFAIGATLAGCSTKCVDYIVKKIAKSDNNKSETNED